MSTLIMNKEQFKELMLNCIEDDEDDEDDEEEDDNLYGGVRDVSVVGMSRDELISIMDELGFIEGKDYKVIYENRDKLTNNDLSL